MHDAFCAFCIISAQEINTRRLFPAICNNIQCWYYQNVLRFCIVEQTVNIIVVSGQINFNRNILELSNICFAPVRAQQSKHLIYLVVQKRPCLWCYCTCVCRSSLCQKQCRVCLFVYGNPDSGFVCKGFGTSQYFTIRYFPKFVRSNMVEHNNISRRKSWAYRGREIRRFRVWFNVLLQCL